MYIYSDKWYKSDKNNVYTEEYLKHEFGDRASEYVGELTEMTYDEKYDYNGTVRCNYAQMFTEHDNMVLCNEMANDIDNLEVENGADYDEETEEYEEIYQYYIIDNNLADFLKRHTDEIIYYHDRLDLSILGVTHFGTSWDYVGADFEA